MTIFRLTRYRVSIPLTSRYLHVVADSPEAAVKAALKSTGGQDDVRAVTVYKKGPNWTFYKVSPPLPRTWLGDTPVATSMVNPDDHITIIEAEAHEEVLVAYGEDNVK